MEGAAAATGSGGQMASAPTTTADSQRNMRRV